MTPRPKLPVCARLHEIHEELGFESLQAFYDRVVDGWAEDDPEFGRPVSYESVRAYHFNQEPPTRYLRRVAHVFGVRPGWLLTGGDGGPFPEEGLVEEAADRAKSPETKAVEEAFSRTLGSSFKSLTPFAKSALFRAWQRYYRVYRGSVLMDGDLVEDERAEALERFRVEVAERIGRAVGAFLASVAGTREGRAGATAPNLMYSDDQLEDFAVSASQAIAALVEPRPPTRPASAYRVDYGEF